MFSRAHICAAAMECGAQVIDFGIHPYQWAIPQINNYFYATYPRRSDGWHRNQSFSSPAFCVRKAFKILKPDFLSGKALVHAGYRGYVAKGRLDSDDFQRLASKHSVLILDGFKLLASDWVIKHQEKLRKIFSISPRIVSKARADMSRLARVQQTCRA